MGLSVLNKLCSELDYASLKRLCQDAGLEKHHLEIVLEYLAPKYNKKLESLEHSHRKDLKKNMQQIDTKLRCFLFSNLDYLSNAMLLDKFLTVT